jgi:hypothetical protein
VDPHMSCRLRIQTPVAREHEETTKRGLYLPHVLSELVGNFEKASFTSQSCGSVALQVLPLGCCASLQQGPDHLQVPAASSFMQWRVAIVGWPVGFSTRGQQPLDNCQITPPCCQVKRGNPVLHRMTPPHIMCNVRIPTRATAESHGRWAERR